MSLSFYFVLIIYISLFSNGNAFHLIPQEQQIKSNDGIYHTMANYVVVPGTPNVVKYSIPWKVLNERKIFKYPSYQSGVNSYFQHPVSQGNYFNSYGKKANSYPVFPIEGNFQNIGGNQITDNQIKTNFIKRGYGHYSANDAWKNSQLVKDHNMLDKVYNIGYKDIYYPGWKKHSTFDVEAFKKMNNKEVNYERSHRGTDAENEDYGFDNEIPLNVIPAQYKTEYKDVEINDINNNLTNVETNSKNLQNISRLINDTDIDAIFASIVMENVEFGTKFLGIIKYVEELRFIKYHEETCVMYFINSNQCWKMFITTLPKDKGYEIEKIHLILLIVEIFKNEIKVGTPVNYVFSKIIQTLEEFVNLSLDDLYVIINEMYASGGFHNSKTIKKDTKYLLERILLKIDHIPLQNNNQYQVHDIQYAIEQFKKQYMHKNVGSQKLEDNTSNIFLKQIITNRLSPVNPYYSSNIHTEFNPIHDFSKVFPESRIKFQTNENNQTNRDNITTYLNIETEFKHNGIAKKGLNRNSSNGLSLMASNIDNRQQLIRSTDTKSTNTNQIREDFDTHYINGNNVILNPEPERNEKIDGNEIVDTDKILIDLRANLNENADIVSNNKAKNEHTYTFNKKSKPVENFINKEHGIENGTGIKDHNTEYLILKSRSHKTLDPQIDIIKSNAINHSQFQDVFKEYREDLKNYVILGDKYLYHKNPELRWPGLKVLLKKPEYQKDKKIVVLNKLERDVKVPKKISKGFFTPDYDTEPLFSEELYSSESGDWSLEPGEKQKPKNVSMVELLHSFVGQYSKYRPFFINNYRCRNSNSEIILKRILDSLEPNNEKDQSTKQYPPRVYAFPGNDVLSQHNIQTELYKYMLPKYDVPILRNEIPIDELNAQLQLKLNRLMQLQGANGREDPGNANEVKTNFIYNAIEQLLTIKSSNSLMKLGKSLLLLYKIMSNIVSLLVQRGVPAYEIKQVILGIKAKLHNTSLQHMSKCVEKLYWEYIARIYSHFQNIMKYYQLLL